MAVVRVPIRSLREGEQILSREAEKYLTVVLRLREDDVFTAFDPERGLESESVILDVKKGRTRVRMGALATSPPMRFVAWLHGLTKGDKNDAIVRDATELGATLIVIVPCERSIPKFKESRGARWQKIADEASRQSGRAKSPEVRVERSWEDGLLVTSVNATPEGALFCLDERATEPLGPDLLHAHGPLVFAAGPEGGLSEREVEAARERSFRVRSLGQRILRTETVPAAVLGASIILAPT